MAEVGGREDHSSGKWENFPVGLRVLVVDDDSLCLKVIEQMLRSCKYEVTTSITSLGALELLRDRKNDFDLVLSDVFMPDMDGFKLLGRIGLELGLPVIMMSSSGDTDVVLKGVTHGAVDFLIKPVRVEELRNVWQHMVRKRKDMGKDLDVDECGRREEAGGGDNSRKRKEQCREGKGDDSYATKKPRVNWSVEMHQQFVNAVNQLGIDKAVPKKILELMGVKGLTRENVASHLQKYRLYLKRLTGVQRAAGRTCSVPQVQVPQTGSDSPGNALASAPLATPPPGAMFAQLPRAPGFLGSMPQGMGTLLPALGALGSNPNLTNMQLQLQNMTIQGALPALAGNLDASSALQPGAVLPCGLGLGMGMNLQAQALMNMGLMPHGVQQDGNMQQQQQQQQQLQPLGMSRSSSAPSTEMANLANAQQLRRNQSAVVPNVADGCAQGSIPAAAVAAVSPSPLPILPAMSGVAAQGATSMVAGLNHVPLPEAMPCPGPQEQSDVPVNTGAPLDMQVKQEDTCARRAGNHVAKVMEPQSVVGAVDIMAAGGGFAHEESLLGMMGMDGELAALGNGDLANFSDTAALPLDEGKDTGMDEFLNAFFRDMNVPVGDGSFGQ